MHHVTRILVAIAAFSGLTAIGDEIDFTRDIRPILSENCSFCHGPDEATREAGLRLDTQSGVADVIEPHDSDASELILRLITDDPDTLMPPPDSNRKLTAQQIDLLRRWIDSGAVWEQHWAFRPIEAPEIPEVASSDDRPIRNPIDAFVQRELAVRGMVASPEASKATLIRRLSLDLTGLPPTPARVAAFLADTRPDAYERLVDELLDSPSYGIRMAWPWLDAARYADTNGYQGDRERSMWPWRDWVVKSFNQNLPFDQFTVWQLAGDLLPEATLEQKLATGFCRNHMINGEGGRIAEENRVEYVMDMSETMGTVWLGLTLNCCRCHDHKYDPISNREYYELFAFFNQTPVDGRGGDPQTPPNLAVPSDSERVELDALAERLSTIDRQLADRSAKLAKSQVEWEASELNRLAQAKTWNTLSNLEVATVYGKAKQLEDQSVLIEGDADNNDYTIVATLDPAAPNAAAPNAAAPTAAAPNAAALGSDPPEITAVRLQALRHPSMTGNGLARSNSGNFVLTDFRVEVIPPSDAEAPGDTAVPENTAGDVKIASAVATFEQGNHAVANSIDEDPKSGWAVYEGRTVDRDHAAVFRFETPVKWSPGLKLRITMRHQSVHKGHNLGRFRLAVTTDPKPQLSADADELLAALDAAPEKRSKEQRQTVVAAHRRADASYQKLQTEKEQVTKRRDALQKSLPKVMVMADMGKPRETFILSRGLYNKPGEQVQAGLPEFLPSSDSSAMNRLTLAQWLVDPANPLTARVTVNRFWQQVFGIGLVKTTEDFGTQGETPIHLDLLNWMAWQFRADGWDVKNLMKLIVTSHTYRQTSKVAEKSAYDLDPANRLLSRSSRYRLPSWMLRDQALAASGLLSPVVGGPSVNTYQPPGVWEEASFGKKTYRRDNGEKLYRRSLYVFWRRIIAPTMFFDSATRQTCTVGINRTNTPLHALQTLNDITFVEAARVLAQTVLNQPQASDAKRVDEVMRRVLSRSASPAEKSVLLKGLERTRHQYAGHQEAAEQLLSIGESPRDVELDLAEHAAWTNLCLAVLNLDETLNRE